MNALPDTCLALVFVVAIGGGLLYVVAGPVIARWIWGDMPGGRK